MRNRFVSLEEKMSVCETIGLPARSLVSPALSLTLLLSTASLAASLDRIPHTTASVDGNSDKYSFAVISDLTGSERERVFDLAVEQINLLRPDFVIGVGDLVENGEAKQFECFRSRAERLTMRFYYTPGNHDMADTGEQYWQRELGRTYYHFRYKDTLFLVLNSEDVIENRELWPAREVVAPAYKAWLEDGDYSGIEEIVKSMSWQGTQSGGLSSEQLDYFEKVLEENRDVRWTFAFLHKPLWQGDGTKSFARLEALLEGRDYTVFAGHVHNYRYAERDGKDYIRMSTTGGRWLSYVDELPRDKNFDHITYVTVSRGEPAIANLRLDGILTKEGALPDGYGDLKLSDRQRQEDNTDEYPPPPAAAHVDMCGDRLAEGKSSGD